MRNPRTRCAAVIAAAVMSLAGASTAQAQTTQEGLVNVAVQDVVVQAPIAVAANICDVNVAVLAEVADDAAACEATADSTATTGSNPNGPTRQEGLVNVLVEDVVVQLPITVAANVCDVNVAVLARVLDDAEACTATADAVATRGPGVGGAAADRGFTGDDIGAATPLGDGLGTAAGTPIQDLLDAGFTLLG
jgi:hypothetical protein